MPYAKLLYIFDADDENIRITAPVHELRNSGAKLIGVRGGRIGLQYELNKLLQDKWIFPSVAFFTHGNSGRISLGKERIDQDTLRMHFADRGYERLFPLPKTRLYFNGCNVAEGDEGWIFLEIAGSVFLKSMGGISFGYTSTGYMMSPLHLLLTSPFTYLAFAGKSIHPTGGRRIVVIGPGGNFVERQ